MWCCSKWGFFSIVEKPVGSWQVRARVRRDLVNLIREAELKVKIVANAGTDYAYRIVVDKAQLVRVFAALMTSVDYPNFKDEIKKRPDQMRKHDIYAKWWYDMIRLQPAQSMYSGAFNEFIPRQRFPDYDKS